MLTAPGTDQNNLETATWFGDAQFIIIRALGQRHLHLPFAYQLRFIGIFQSCFFADVHLDAGLLVLSPSVEVRSQEQIAVTNSVNQSTRIVHGLQVAVRTARMDVGYCQEIE